MSECTNCPDDLKALCMEHYGVDGSPNCVAVEPDTSAHVDTATMQLLGKFLTLERKWMDLAGPVAVFRGLCNEARGLGAVEQLEEEG